MGLYIHFSQDQKTQAAEVNLETFLLHHGEKLLPSGQDKRLAADHSITIRGCRWYDHAEGRGGNAISFVQQYYHLPYPEAVTMLLGGELGLGYPTSADHEESSVKPFVLPPAHANLHRVFSYLTKCRKIAPEVVTYFAKAGTLYEDSRYHNCVFVGRDAAGLPRHAHKRSSSDAGKIYRQTVAGSDSRYSFHHLGSDGQLYVFEAPIDLLSYLTLHPEDWLSHSYVACCGLSSVPVLAMLDQQPLIHEVFLCLDHDEAGHTASLRMAEQLEKRPGIIVSRLIPQNKDWNDDLCAQQSDEVFPMEVT